MKKIQSKHITLAFCALVLFVGLAFSGHLIPGVLFLLAYVVIDRKYLRCPHCGGFTNLDRLFYAKKHSYHCSSCGERIEIEGNQNYG